MALFKNKIDFDPADPTSFDRVGSFILGAAGDVATTTDLGGGVIALDVNVGNMVLDSDAGVFLEDSAASSGDKGQSILLVRQDTLAVSTSTDGDYGHFKSNNKGELYVKDADVLAMLTTIEGDLDTANASLAAINADTTAILADTATIDSNLASLVKAEDAAAGNGYNGIAVFAVRNDAGTSLVGSDGDFSALSLDAVGRLRSFATLDLASLVSDDAVASEKALPVAVTAVATSTALGAVSAAGDKADLRSDLNRRLLVNEACMVGWQVTAGTVGTSAAQIDGTPLASRNRVTFQNKSSKSIWLKNANTVTNANSIEVPKYSERDLPFSAALPIWAIGEEAGQAYRFLEAG